MGRQVTRQPYAILYGGLNKKATDLLVQSSPSGPLQSPDTFNSEFSELGGVGKRAGKNQEGNTVTTSDWVAPQTTATSVNSFQVSSNTVAFCQKIVSPGAGKPVSSVALRVWVLGGQLNISSVKVTIRADASGPGAVITNGTSEVLAGTDLPIANTGDTEFKFPVIPTPGAGTFWFCVEGVSTAVAPATAGIAVAGSAIVGATQVKTTTDNYSTTPDSLVLEDMRYSIKEFVGVIQGLFDFNTFSGGVKTQSVISVSDGVLNHQPGPAPLTGAWTPIHSALATGQDNLFDMAVLSNHAVFTDYANTANRFWDNTLRGTTSTMTHGYRPSFNPVDQNGLDAIPDGTYRIMAVTTLKSGGFRAKDLSVTLSGGTPQNILVDSIFVDAVFAQFHFDIDATATTWFMTEAGENTFHKIADSNMSTTNPTANNVASFTITAITNLTDGNTLVEEYGRTQAYFELQEDTPKAKFLQSGDGFLTMAGDPDNPSRWWVSSLNEPQIWSIAGGTDGTFYEVGGENDGQEITGIKYALGSFFVFKNKDVYRYKFTGDSNQPFVNEKLRSNDISLLSHFSAEEIPQGVIFPAGSGMAICDGVSVKPFGDNEIGNLFESTDEERFNLSSMKFSTSLNHSNKQQVWFGVSSTNSNIRDQVLIYDYQLNNWTLHNGISGNYFATILDSNGFSTPWSGDYSSRVYRHDTGTNDAGANISWTWDTPNFVFGDVDGWARLNRISIKGDVQSAGTLLVDVFKDYSTTSSFTLSYDMTDTRFVKGLDLPVNAKAQAVRLKLRNSELDVPVQIQSITLYHQNLGSNK